MAVKAPAVIITAKDATRRAFASVGKGLKGISRAAGRITKSVAKVGAAAAAAGIAAMGALVASSMKSVDELAKVSDKLGTTTEALAGLHHAAEITGVSAALMDKSMQRLTYAVSEATTGVGLAKDAIIELGLDAEVVNKMPLDEKMATLADAFENVENHADKVRISMVLFGAKGGAVLNTLAAGREGLAEFAREAQHLGLAVSRVDAAQIEQANDAVTRAKGVFTGLGNQLATAFSPVIQGVADAFRQSALDTEDFGSIGQRVVDSLVRAVGILGNVVLGMQIYWMEWKIAVFQIINAVKVKWNEFLDLIPDFDFLDPVTGAIGKGFDFIKGKVQDGIDVIKGFGEDALEGTTTFSEGLGIATDETEAWTAELQAMYARMGTNPPSEGIQTWYTDVQTGSRRTAEVIAANAPGKVLLEDAENNMGPAVNAVIQKYNFMQKQIMAGEKKRTEFMALTETERAASVIGTMSQTFGKNKALQIANAIMQTYQGATLALSSYPPPLNFAMAAAVVAAGLQNVAQIKAQSFEGGGFTGSGSRSGGLDGKGGFLGMLHPNESVIDHTRGGGSPIVINNTVDASGADPMVDQKIRLAMQEASMQTIAAIGDLRRRGRGP